MQRNHLHRNRNRRDPAIARFWDALVAQPDNLCAGDDDLAEPSNPRHNFAALS